MTAPDAMQQRTGSTSVKPGATSKVGGLDAASQAVVGNAEAPSR